MENKEGLEILTKRISSHRISEKYQKFLPHIVKRYFEGKPLEQLKTELGRRDKKFAIEIYDRLEQIKMNGLRKISGIIAKYPDDLKDDSVFADTVITYCIKFSNLEKEIFKVFRQLDKKDKNLLYKRYKNGETSNDDYYALKTIAKKPGLYILIIDQILNGNY